MNSAALAVLGDEREERPCYSRGSPQTTQPGITDLRVKNWRKP